MLAVILKLNNLYNINDLVIDFAATFILARKCDNNLLKTP